MIQTEANPLQALCECGHPSLDHAGEDGKGACDGCDCTAFRLDRWWERQEESVTLQSTDRFVEELYMRQVRGTWEYAVVNWHYQSAYLRVLVRDGVVIVSPDV